LIDLGFEILTNYDFEKNEICAGAAGEKGVCDGDSGGPFVVEDNKTNSYYIAGVVSYSDQFCKASSGYTKVSAYETWITQTIADHSDNSSTSLKSGFLFISVLLAFALF